MFGRGCSNFGGYGFGGYGYGASGPVNSGFSYLAIGLRVFIILAVLVLIISLFRYMQKGSDNAVRILDERYAKGDIGEEEYFSIKSNLARKK